MESRRPAEERGGRGEEERGEGGGGWGRQEAPETPKLYRDPRLFTVEREERSGSFASPHSPGQELPPATPSSASDHRPH